MKENQNRNERKRNAIRAIREFLKRLGIHKRPDKSTRAEKAQSTGLSLEYFRELQAQVSWQRGGVL